MENINLDVNAVLQTITSQRAGNPAAVDRMFDFIRLVLNRQTYTQADLEAVLASALRPLISQQGVIMADLKKMQDDVTATKANLDEARGDLAELSTQSQALSAQVQNLEGTVADLRKQLESTGQNTEALDALEASIADLKVTSREIADVVPEPTPEPEPEPTPVVEPPTEG